MRETLNKQQQVLSGLVKKLSSASYLKLDVDEFLSSVKTGKNNKIWVLGAGKASVEMARKVEAFFGDRIYDGIIIAPEKQSFSKKIQVFKGSHPKPDKNTISASYELMQLAAGIPKGDTVIFCLSGGASSLLCIPPKNVELEELTTTYDLLLKSGAGIREINTVRKHISDINGGRLGKILAHTNLVSLILSDVPGDDPETIGSGPTVPDSSTYKEAFQVLKKYSLWDRVSHAVRIHITKGMHGDVEESLKPGNLKDKNHKVKVISGAKAFAGKVSEELEKSGYNSWMPKEAYGGDVRKVSKEICAQAVSVLSKGDPVKKPGGLIYFGESTVQVKGEGKGGRNQELALASAISLEGQHPISLLSFGTDGIDGPTDAAGAIINSETILKARKQKLDPEEFLQNNDSYSFHRIMKTLLKTGPTGNNLMDLQVVLIG